MGAYTQGVLISACNILVTYGCAETDIFYSFSANSCLVLVAFLKPEIYSAIDRSLPVPAHQFKAPGIKQICEVFAMFC